MPKYRPEGWKNPHSDSIMSGWVHVGLREKDAFEAGADAMLAALRSIIPDIDSRIEYYNALKKGHTNMDYKTWLSIKDVPIVGNVFIPDDTPEVKP
jgi:hypothetical protein